MGRSDLSTLGFACMQSYNYGDDISDHAASTCPVQLIISKACLRFDTA